MTARTRKRPDLTRASLREWITPSTFGSAPGSTWEGGRGTNRIAREFDDLVVVERFEASEPEPFRGMSLSVFDPDAGWRQTWVDSNGSYWHFDGAAIDGGFVFATPEPVDDERLLKRMVFSDIRPTSFDWRWEASPDGVAWTERWWIRYRRM